MANSKSSKRGGSGAAEHAIAVFGNMNEQHAQEGSNVIATKVGGSGAAEHAIAVFGNMNEQHAQEGSNVIATKVGGKSQGGKQQQLQELQQKLNEVLAQKEQEQEQHQNVIVGGQQQDKQLQKLQQLQQLLQQRGGKLNKQQIEKLDKQLEQQGGEGVLSTIVVPAVLLYANHRYGKRSSNKLTRKGKRLTKNLRRSARK
jgi:sirohydrochlorin ferrochelatase